MQIAAYYGGNTDRALLVPMSNPANQSAKSNGTGRPRNEATRRLILRTALELLKKQTLQSISIEAIAKEAGVGKATIYRWWDSKAAVIIDAFIEHHVVHTPLRRELPPDQALIAHMQSVIKQYRGWGGRIVAQIIGATQSDASVAREFQSRFVNSRRSAIKSLLEEWHRAGGLQHIASIDKLQDVLYSPIYMRLLVTHEPLDSAFSDDMTAYICSLLRIRPPNGTGQGFYAPDATHPSRKGPLPRRKPSSFPLPDRS